MLKAAHLRRLLCLLSCLAAAAPAVAQDVPEYRLKAAFVYNFMVFTEWPDDTAPELTLCIVGRDPFGAEIDAVARKRVAHRAIAIQRLAVEASLSNCQVVFIARSAITQLERVLDKLADRHVLTVADTQGAMQRGVQLNMEVKDSKVTFEANLDAARRHHLQLSSKLLQLATEVKQ